MALTHSIVRKTVAGNRRFIITSTTFDSSYTTGGVSLTPSSLGLSHIDHIDGALVPAGAHIGKSATYDYTAQKLVALVAANTEVTNATDLSAMTVRLKVVGD